MKNNRTKDNPVTPINSELEQSVLSGALIDPDVADIVMTMTHDRDYAHPTYQQLYRAMAEAYESAQAIDITTIDIKMGEVGIELDLPELIKVASSISNITAHIDMLRCYTIKRAVYSDCANLMGKVTDPATDAYDLADEMLTKASELTTTQTAKHTKTVREHIDTFEYTEGYRTGDTDIDTVLYQHSGIHPGQMNVTIGESGHGKTRFELLKTALLAGQGIKTHWFQLEDFGYNTAKYFDQRLGILADEHILISDNLETIESIRREARISVREFGTQNIVIDYVQNVTSESRSRAEEVEYISRQFTKMAKELGVSVQLLSQMTVQDTQRKKWKLEPRENDVRWSKQLKQDAASVTTVFRPFMVAGLQDGDATSDWAGNWAHKDSVYVGKAKDRYGSRTFRRVHFIDTDEGLINQRIFQMVTHEKNNAHRMPPSSDQDLF